MGFVFDIVLKLTFYHRRCKPILSTKGFLKHLLHIVLQIFVLCLEQSLLFGIWGDSPYLLWSLHCVYLLFCFFYSFFYEFERISLPRTIQVECEVITWVEPLSSFSRWILLIKNWLKHCWALQSRLRYFLAIEIVDILDT